MVKLESTIRTDRAALITDLSKGVAMTIQKHSAMTVFTFCALLALSSVGFTQDPQPSLVASANGEGKIKLGKEEFKLDAVVVKGFQDA